MSRPSSSTSPSTRAVGTVSCMRFRQRRNVDFPHPDGPMIAVTCRSWMRIDTPFTACTLPKYASSEPTRIRGVASNLSAGRATSDTSSRRFGRSVAATGREAGTRCEARDETDDEDERDEDERSGPSEGMPCVIGTYRVGEDLQGKGGDRLFQRERPELIAERGEQQRCRLAGDARDGDQRAGDDARARRTKHDRKRGAPARVAEGERGLAKRDGNDADHLLRGARDHGNHHRAERHTAGEGGEVAYGSDEELPCKYSHHDRRKPVQHIRQEAHTVRQSRPLLRGQIEPGAHTDRQPEGARQPDEDERADDRIRESAAGLPHRLRHLREEVPRERADAEPQQVREDEDQREHGQHRGGDEHPEHHAAKDSTPLQGTHRALAERTLAKRRPQRRRHRRSRGTQAALPLVFRDTCHTSQRAIAFTISVMTKSTNATAISAERCASLDASLNSFASSDAIV